MKISKDALAVIAKVTETGTCSFLLLKRFDKDKQEDHFRLVKGGVEVDESSAETAEREAAEEVGVKTKKNLGLVDSYQYVVGEIKHEVEVYLLVAEERGVSLDSSEEGGFTIKDAIWCNEEESIKKLNFAIEKEMIKKASVKLQGLFN